jgi:hypothetical protein
MNYSRITNASRKTVFLAQVTLRAVGGGDLKDGGSTPPVEQSLERQLFAAPGTYVVRVT